MGQFALCIKSYNFMFKIVLQKIFPENISVKKIRNISADPVAELVKAGVSSHSILRSTVRLSASLRPPIFRNYFSDYVMLQ